MDTQPRKTSANQKVQTSEEMYVAGSNSSKSDASLHEAMIEKKGKTEERKALAKKIAERQGMSAEVKARFGIK